MISFTFEKELLTENKKIEIIVKKTPMTEEDRLNGITEGTVSVREITTIQGGK